MFIYSPYNSTVTSTSVLSTILIYGVYLASFIIVLAISIIIIHLTCQNSKMRTVSNMLICNTCLISLLYSITTFLQIFMVVFNTHHKYADSRTTAGQSHFFWCGKIIKNCKELIKKSEPYRKVHNE
jgi:apolipoprotein N-acyltransferase